MMRPNRLGWVMVGFFLVGGIGFWIVMPDVFIGQIWIGVAVVLALYYFRMNRRADRAEELQRTGVAGRAQIVEMTQTGTYVNEQPRVKLKLRIEAPGIAPFEDERTETVPLIALGRLSGGAPLAVYLKPEDPSGYVIDWLGGGAGPMPAGTMSVGDPSRNLIDLRSSSSARDAVLEALRDHGVDVAHQVAARDPSAPIEDKGEPVERMMKLQQMREANLISAEEFDRYRKQILEEL